MYTLMGVSNFNRSLSTESSQFNTFNTPVTGKACIKKQRLLIPKETEGSPGSIFRPVESPYNFFHQIKRYSTLDPILDPVNKER